MGEIAVRLTVKPLDGPTRNYEGAIATDGVTRFPVNLTEQQPEKIIDLVPAGKDIHFLLISAVTDDENTTLQATLSRQGVPNVEFPVLGFPLVLGSGATELLDGRRRLKLTLGGAKKDTTVDVVVGREG